MYIKRFINRNAFGLFFLLLLSISIWLTVNHNLYNRSDFINSSNGILGYFYVNVSEINSYFRLKTENKQLFEENTSLKEFILNQIEKTENKHLFEENTNLKEFILNQIEKEDNIYTSWSAPLNKDIKIIGAKIIKNSFVKQKNILTLKGGIEQGIEKNMGVINDKGIVGIIDKVSDNYATVLSVLNTDFRSVAKIKKNDHFGTLIWNGKNPNIIQLIDIQRTSHVSYGDTIVTGSSSMAFPENIPIGRVEKIYFDKQFNSFILDVLLFNDMTRLNYVYVTGNIHRNEIEKLEEDEW